MRIFQLQLWWSTSWYKWSTIRYLGALLITRYLVDGRMNKYCELANETTDEFRVKY